MRCFIAINFPDIFKEEIIRIQNLIQEKSKPLLLSRGCCNKDNVFFPVSKNLDKPTPKGVGRNKDFLIRKDNIFIGKFTEKENLHLTLKFLGEIDENEIERVKIKLRDLDFSKFYCELGEIGVFSKDFLRIIWIKVNGKIFDLQNEIDKNLEDIFEKENRFMSHITIARIKNVRDKRKFIEFMKKVSVNKINFSVDEFSLMESKLSSKGAVYKELEKYRLES